ncbi:hypothetical protein GF386_03890 [Candidatus Pacearchaeota archaeon]|nr:hypothetical protein [Candidatus Pacearchaeota archaeon]MBD3283289.1 hypothetical protein [Candidatus Pacearchaeota archaeon]
MKVLMFVLMFLLIGGFFIISNENIKMNNAENLELFIDLYSEWINRLISNSGSLSGYVVKMEWLPQNENDSEG